MKYSRVVIVVAVFLITTGLLLMLMLSPFSRLNWKSVASTFSSSQSAGGDKPRPYSDTRIAQENALLGTKKWRYNLDKETSVYIQAYADAASISPGQKLTFFVSTQNEGTRYTISLYRLGWYGGDGARLMRTEINPVPTSFLPGHAQRTEINPVPTSFLPGHAQRTEINPVPTSFLPGHAQGYYDSSQHALVNCHSCLVNMTTGLVEANWRSSYVLKVPSDWVTGVYLAKFTDEHNYTAVVPFDVRGNTHARYVVVTPDTAYQAYNSWGGFSLFTAMANSVQHGVQVSFNRPYLSGQDTSQLFDSELDAIRWMEMQGYDLSYVSDVDVHEHPRLLLDHRAYISLGQDTFWTKEMRDGVEYARDHGVGLAFLGAETGTWQMRFEPDHRGDADRTIVSYRVSSASHNLQFDPFYEKDASRVTAQWRDPFLARPENALLGVMFSGFTQRPTNFAWHINSRTEINPVPTSLLSSTGLAFGKEYGCALVGNVWDRVFENGSTPSGLSILATSRTINASNQPDVSNSTSYIAPSGALVFATGSLYWNRGLDGYRFHQDPQCPLQESAVPEIQRLMANVMNALIVSHKPAQAAQMGQMLPLITTPYAIVVPDGASQGGLMGVRDGSVLARRSFSRTQKMGASNTIQKSSFSSIHSAPGNRTGGKTKSSYSRLQHGSLRSFRAGRQGRRVHTRTEINPVPTQSYYQSAQFYSLPANVRSEEKRLLSMHHTTFWRSVLTRLFGTFRRHHW